MIYKRIRGIELSNVLPSSSSSLNGRKITKERKKGERVRKTRKGTKREGKIWYLRHAEQ